MNSRFLMTSLLVAALAPWAHSAGARPPLAEAMHAPRATVWWCEIWVTGGLKTRRPVTADNETLARQKARDQWGRIGRIGRCSPA